MKYETVLVTGAAGFIGSHLCDKLLAEGLEVIGVDNFLSGKKENIAHLKNNKKFIFYNIDVSKKENLYLPFIENNIQLVFNLMASKKTICLKDPHRDLEINAGGTLNLLQLSKEYGVKKFVHISTGSVYGDLDQRVMYETHPLRPRSYYGISKLAGERYVDMFYTAYDMNTSICRLFHVYGERQDASDVGGVVSIFTDKIMHKKPITVYGTGNQERVFTYVKDVVNALWLVANEPISKGRVYNVCAKQVYKLSEVHKLLQDKLSYRPIVRYKDWVEGDVKKFRVANNKIMSIGAEFRTSLSMGIDNLIAWYQDKNKKDLEDE